MKFLYKYLGAAVIFSMPFFLSGAEKTLAVWWEYFPQIVQLVDEYNATEPIHLSVMPSVTSWPDENMKAPDQSSARGFIASDMRIPAEATVKFHKTPLWYDGLALYANKQNPLLKQLGQTDFSTDTLKRIWTTGVTWEELAGQPPPGRNKVNPYSANRNALANFTGTKNLHYNDTGWHFAIALNKVRNDIWGLGTIELRTNYVMLRKLHEVPDNIQPLALKKQPNGNWRLVPVVESDARKGFARIVENGDFIRFAFNVLTRDPNDPIGAKLAESAKRLGADTILAFGYFPLTTGKDVKRMMPRFVFAHAMGCFLFGGVTDWGRVSNIPKDDFAHWLVKDNYLRAWWPQDLSDRAHKASLETATLDLDLAEAAGLDALGILLGPETFVPNGPTYKAFRYMVQAAEKHKVKIIPDIWDFYKRNADLEEQRFVLNFLAGQIVDLMKQYPNAFYKRGTQYVICFGDPVSRGNYNDIKRLFNLFGGRENIFLIVGITDQTKLNDERGWSDGADLLTSFPVHLSWGDKMLENIFLRYMNTGKKICWPAHSSMYTNTGDMHRRQMAESLGAARLIDTWRDAIKYQSEAVYIPSWNDFSEDHHITQSNYRGDSFMRITKYFADWFRNGAAPEITEERLFLFHHRQLVDAKITEGKWCALEPSWQSTPVSDYVHVVTMLKKMGNLELELGNEKLRLENVPVGFHEWLVYVPKAKNYDNNFPDWNNGAYRHPYPENDAVRSVTKIAHLNVCRPKLTLVRDGKVMGSVSGRTEIVGEARFSDLCVVGNSVPIK